MSTAATEEPKAVDVRRLTFTVAAVVSILGLAFLGGTEFKSLRLAAEAGATSDLAIINQIKDLPTKDSVENTVREVFRPVEIGMAEMRVEIRAVTEMRNELRALADRVNKIEESKP